MLLHLNRLGASNGARLNEAQGGNIWLHQRVLVEKLTDGVEETIHRCLVSVLSSAFAMLALMQSINFATITFSRELGTFTHLFHASTAC